MQRNLGAPPGFHWAPLAAASLATLPSSGYKSHQCLCAPACPHSGHTLPFGPGAPYWWHQADVAPHGHTLWAPLDPPGSCCFGHTTHTAHSNAHSNAPKCCNGTGSTGLCATAWCHPSKIRQWERCGTSWRPNAASSGIMWVPWGAGQGMRLRNSIHKSNLE